MKFITYNAQTFKRTKYYALLPKEEQEAFDVLTQVFHFKTNNYILETLIHWKNVPNDPMYRLFFPCREMLPADDYLRLRLLMHMGMGPQELASFVKGCKKRMMPRLTFLENCHAIVDNLPLKGVFRDFETIANLCPAPMLITCHAYCSYCIRWVVFNNKKITKGSYYTHPQTPVAYLKEHPETKDALFTGADPMVTHATVLKKYIKPILDVETIDTIRISTKSLSYWPFRFTTDKDADDVLRLFEHIVAKGKHLTLIAHLTHARELESQEISKAIKRIQNTGAVIRGQGPLVKGINDTAEDWSQLWTRQLKLGMIPFYMFIEANHHPTQCFRVPLAKALKVFQQAQRLTSGTARTVIGPVFMNDINRVLLDGTTTVDGKKYFVLKSLQAPPGTHSEGRIKLMAYDEDTSDAGDLFALFNPEWKKEGAVWI